MRNHNQLFFPCLESPLRLYLSVATAESSPSNYNYNEEADFTANQNNDEPKEDRVPARVEVAEEEESANVGKARSSSATAPSPNDSTSSPSRWEKQKRQYLSLHSLDKKKVCVSETPHEWSLLWRTAAAPHCDAAVGEHDKNSLFEEDDYHHLDGVRSSAFFLQSTDRKVFLTCDAEGKLGTCTREYLQAKQEQELKLEQEQKLKFQEETAAGISAAASKKSSNVAAAAGDDQGSFAWTLDYEDESGMVVSLINATYQRKLAILHSSDDHVSSSNKKNEKHICTTLPVVPKALSCEDEEDDHMLSHASPSSPPPPATSTSHWRMRFRSGELLFLSNPTIHRSLRCNAFGKLTLDENRKGWEVFRFVEAGHGGYVQIVSWTHDSYLLYSNQYGKVGMTQNVESPNALWAITRFRGADDGTPGGVLLRSARHGRYLSALNETELATVEEQNFPFAAVQWELDAANSNLFFLTTTTTAPLSAESKSHSSGSTRHHFLSSRLDGNVFSAKRGKDWEEWKLEAVAPEGKSCSEGGEDSKLPANDSLHEANLFSIYSTKHERYLGSSEDGKVYTVESLGESECWDLEESPDGDGYILISGDRQLFCNHEGELETSPTECQAWNLQCRMPSSISKNQIAVAGVAAATMLVASPLSLALGAAARAPLAAMMIGGAEVVAAEAAVAYGVGTAVLGTSAAAAIIADHKRRLDAKKSQQNELPIQTVNRPLIGWRTW